MWRDQIVRTKPLQQLLDESTSEDEHSLHRSLDVKALIALGIGAVIGTGIFVLTGTAAANNAGPALVLSFVLSGFGCALAALCYAEFAAMIPISGSAYTYSYVTVGELMAWIIGWNLVLEYLFAAATVSVGWSGYFVHLIAQIGIHLPPALTSAPFTHDHETGWRLTGAIINLPATAIVAVVTSVLYVGVGVSSRINSVIVVIKVAVIALFVLFGASHIVTSNWVPFIPENTGRFGEYGWSGIMRGAGVIFFAYIGFDTVSTAAQEAKNPQRDMPIGIIGSLAICTVLYIAVALVLTGMVNYKELNVAAPVALALDKAGSALNWMKPIVDIGALAGLTSVILVMLLGQPRIFYTMARDGLIPPVFAKVHPKFKTPHINTVITGAASALIGGLFPIALLGELVSIGTLLAFVFVCLGIPYLRRTHPDAPRPFRTPFLPWVPIGGALICFLQMLALPHDTWIRLLVWLTIGLVIYFGYGIKHSRLRR